MKTTLRFIVAFVVAIVAIVIAVLLGDYGPWYLSWFLGTGFMILVAALGGILYEEQEDSLDQPTHPSARPNKLAPRELEY